MKIFDTYIWPILSLLPVSAITAEIRVSCNDQNPVLHLDGAFTQATPSLSLEVL